MNTAGKCFIIRDNIERSFTITTKLSYLTREIAT